MIHPDKTCVPFTFFFYTQIRFSSWGALCEMYGSDELWEIALAAGEVMFGLQCVYYTGSVVTSDWAAGPQSQSSGWSSFLEGEGKQWCQCLWGEVVWRKISLRGVRESYTHEDEKTAFNDLNVSMIRQFKPS